jgi:hypothetical protein
VSRFPVGVGVFMLVMAMILLSGCTTYQATNRILVCFGFCALQGVQVVKQEDGKEVLVVPRSEVPKTKE